MLKQKQIFEKLANERINIIKFIKLFNEYSKIISEAKYKTKYGEGLKILTPKQMFLRLP